MRKLAASSTKLNCCYNPRPSLAEFSYPFTYKASTRTPTPTATARATSTATPPATAANAATASYSRRAVTSLMTYRNRLLLIICSSALCITASSGQATIITVTNTNDSGPGSLRQALFDSHDDDTVNFDPALKGQTILLSTAELLINKNITVSGPGANLLTVARAQNAPAFRIFDLAANHAVTIRGLTINNGYAQNFGCGGGILNSGSTLLLMNCTVSGNSTDGTGGGICVDTNSTLTVESSTLTGNYAGDYGGGVANSGTLIINNSTLSDNRGEFAGGGVLSGILNMALLTVSNSTLSGNTTQLHGGGIWTSGHGAISNSTLSGNSGTNGGAINNRLGTLEIKSTILKRGESGSNIVNDSGTLTSGGYNLSSDDGSGYLIGPGDQINTDPLLGLLQNNGGPTFTHALLPGSPAIDTGDVNFTPPPLFDQRGPGFNRVVNGRIDKGSFEVQFSSTPTPTPSATATTTPTPTATATATTTPTATATATPTATATATPTGTATPTPRPKPTPRFHPTMRPRPTPRPRL